MASFNAGGLASGIDTNSIVETLTKLEGRSLDLLHNRQAALRSQVSLLGELSSKLDAFKTAISGLSSNGALGVTASTNTAFGLAPSAFAAAGTYSLAVTSLASAAKERSQEYNSPTELVRGGTLTLGVNGTNTNLLITDGAPLSDVAAQINQSGAAVGAVIVSDATGAYLSITARNTGFDPASTPASALTVTMTPTGVMGAPIATTTVNAATNGVFQLDGLTLTRQTNTISDAVPGAILTLKALSPLSGGLPVPEEGVLSSSVEQTNKNLGAFVTAYNDLVKLVQKQTQFTPGANRATTLAGDSTVRTLQRSMQRLISTEVPGSAELRSLADLGVKTARDGTISIDQTALGAALTRNAGTVNQLFAQAGTGLAAVGEALVTSYVNPTDGLLATRTSGLNKSIALLDQSGEKMQLRLDAFKKNLIAQFTAMETVVSSLKSIGTFLSSQPAFKVES